MAHETDELRAHQFDGIREYDNPLPRWWLGIFYVTIAFSLFYVPWVHFGDGKTILAEYEAQLAEADDKWGHLKIEWDAAKLKGAQASWRSQPIGYEEADGKVTGVRCQALDENKKPIEGQTHVVPAQLVLVAIGQGKLGHLLAGVDGVEVNWGQIVVDDAQATGRPGWYAGGDCSNGAKEVVNAVAEGRDAARSIHRYLSEK